MIELFDGRFADLYAGSGAVGIEAVSRGAAHTLLVESDARAAKAIRDNIATLRIGPAARLAAGPDGEPYDVVFADPPYAVPDAEVTDVQRALVEFGWLAPDAVVIFERSTRTEVRGAPLTWVDGITADRAKRYGETTLWYGRRS